MADKKALSLGIVAGLSLVLLGAVLTYCSMPVFSYTQEEVQEVPRSEVIMDYSFDINRSQDKMVQVQLSIGQKLNILATGNGIFNFSIVNFTNTQHAIQPDKPDLIYFFLNNTSSVNTTWSPQVRIAQPGSYYLVYLTRDSSPDSPVQIYANVTKTWTDLQIRQVVAADRIPLIDPNFMYIGLGTTIFGAVILLFTFYPRHRPRNRRRTRSPASH